MQRKKPFNSHNLVVEVSSSSNEVMCCLFSMVVVVVVALDLVALYWYPYNLRLWIWLVLTINHHLHYVDQNMWHQFLSFYSPDRMDPVKLERNQNTFPFVEFLDWHRALMQLTHVMLHLAKCKSVVHLMAHYHVEILMLNDDVQSNKIHATTMDMSK